MDESSNKKNIEKRLYVCQYVVWLLSFCRCVSMFFLQKYHSIRKRKRKKGAELLNPSSNDGERTRKRSFLLLLLLLFFSFFNIWRTLKLNYKWQISIHLSQTINKESVSTTKNNKKKKKKKKSYCTTQESL